MDPITKALIELQETALLTWRALRRSIAKPLYLRETVQQLDMIGVGSLPIVILCGFFFGAVLTLNAAGKMQSFGAPNLTGRLLMTPLIRELGPGFTSSLICGRVVSSV